MSLLLASNLSTLAATQDQRPLEWIKREKIRMGWSPANLDQYKKMVDSGMNAVMPRFELDVTDAYNPEAYRQPLSPGDGDIMDQILDGSSLAKNLGLRYFHCLGLACVSQTVAGGFLNNSARYNDGKMPSPLDQVYWQRVILDRVDRVLKLLQDREKYALDAIVIDPEMYALDDALPGEPDYGKFAFELFLSESEKKKPLEEFVNWEERKTWLEAQGLHSQYVQWQFDSIKEMGQQLRALVDRYDMDLILGYIIYEDRMWFNALSAGLATEKMPVFVGVESTYSGVMDPAMIDLFTAMRESIAVPCLLTPGIDLGLIKNQVPTQRLKALEGNIYQRCQHTAGYWVFAIYRFGETEEDQFAFFQTLKVVNTALDEQARTGKISENLKEGPIPVDVPPGFHELLARGQQMRPADKEMAKAALPYIEPGLRGTYTRLLWPEPGKRQSVTYRSIQLNPNYLDRCETQLFDREGKQIYDGPVDLNLSRTIWLPDVVSGFCAQVVSGGMNSFGIPSDEVASMIATDDMLIVNSRNNIAGRFYFHVPEDRKEFRIKLLGHDSMTVDYVLYDAKSQPVKNWKRVTENREETVSVENPGVWCMQIGNIINDGGFRLLDLPNLFGLQPEQVRVSGIAGEN